MTHTWQLPLCQINIVMECPVNRNLIFLLFLLHQWVFSILWTNFLQKIKKYAIEYNEKKPWKTVCKIGVQFCDHKLISLCDLGTSNSKFPHLQGLLECNYLEVNASWKLRQALIDNNKVDSNVYLLSHVPQQWRQYLTGLQCMTCANMQSQST